MPKYLFLLQCPYNRWNCWDRLRQPQIPRLSRFAPAPHPAKVNVALPLPTTNNVNVFTTSAKFPENWENSRHNLFSNGGHQISRSPSVKIVKTSTQKNLIDDRVLYLTCGIVLRMRLACWDTQQATDCPLQFYCPIFAYPTAHCVVPFVQGAMGELSPSRRCRIAKANLLNNVSPSSVVGFIMIM